MAGAGISTGAPRRHCQFDAIGTTWYIEASGPEAAFEAAVGGVIAMIGDFDRVWSRFRTDSDVSAWARHGGARTLSRAEVRLWSLYERLYRITDGAVTPLIGQVLADAGYDADYSLRPQPLTSPPAWDEVLAFDAAGHLAVKRPALLDIGAAGKGLLVDESVAALAAAGLDDVLVDGSGDLATRGARAVRLGLEDPRDVGRAVGVAELTVGALCGSAANRRRWGEFHHIIDPRRLAPVSEVLATWAVHESAMVADGLATALWFTAPERLAEAYDFEYVIIDRHAGIRWSREFPGEVFA